MTRLLGLIPVGSSGYLTMIAPILPFLLSKCSDRAVSVQLVRQPGFRVLQNPRSPEHVLSFQSRKDRPDSFAETPNLVGLNVHHDVVQQTTFKRTEVEVRSWLRDVDEAPRFLTTELCRVTRWWDRVVHLRCWVQQQGVPLTGNYLEVIASPRSFHSDGATTPTTISWEVRVGVRWQVRVSHQCGGYAVLHGTDQQ
ncbi:hypothetical protein D3C87_1344580 [compost metagenome]